MFLGRGRGQSSAGLEHPRFVWDGRIRHARRRLYDERFVGSRFGSKRRTDPLTAIGVGGSVGGICRTILGPATVHGVGSLALFAPYVVLFSMGVCIVAVGGDISGDETFFSVSTIGAGVDHQLGRHYGMGGGAWEHRSIDRTAVVWFGSHLDAIVRYNICTSR